MAAIPAAGIHTGDWRLLMAPPCVVFGFDTLCVETAPAQCEKPTSWYLHRGLHLSCKLCGYLSKSISANCQTPRILWSCFFQLSAKAFHCFICASVCDWAKFSAPVSILSTRLMHFSETGSASWTAAGGGIQGCPTNYRMAFMLGEHWALYLSTDHILLVHFFIWFFYWSFYVGIISGSHAESQNKDA